MNSRRLARSLIRLYPRAWRERYGDELVALVDEREIGIGDVADLAIGAVRERVLAPWGRPAHGTPTRAALILIGLASLIVLINSSATAVAMLLTRIPTPPRVWMEGGQTMVLPPLLPSWGGVLGPVVMVAAFVRGAPRLWRMVRASSNSRIAPPASLPRRELMAWTLLAFVGSATHQWLFRTAALGTGIAPWSWWAIWCSGAIGVYLTLLFLLIPMQGTSRREYERRRAEQFDELRRRAPRFPLGLGGQTQ